MPYDHIQFLAYELYTGPAGLEGSQYYLGLADDDADIEARCNMMGRAMDAALAQAGPAGKTTLKLFMAPEFFFRGVNGAYPMAAVMGAGANAAHPGIIGRLQALASDPKWEDWIFVFGTIIASSDPYKEAGLHQVYNVSLVQAGGPDNKGDVGARIVLKKFQSDSDFIDREKAAKLPVPPHPDLVLYDDMVEHITPADEAWNLADDDLNASVGGSEEQSKNYDGNGIFSLRGVTFGMEICLDHALGRLLQARKPGALTVQVQLVPSAGMTIKNDRVMVGIGGLIVNCDGIGFGTDLWRVNSNLPKPTPAYATLDMRQAGPDGQPGVDATALFPATAWNALACGRIAVYPAVQMPAPGVVPGQVRTLQWNFRQGDVEFTLIYDQNGKFQSALCRMGTEAGNLNHLLYRIPIRRQVGDPSEVRMQCAYVNPLGSAQAQRRGMIVVSGSEAGDRNQITCSIRMDDFDFEGVVMDFFDEMARGEPDTVGMAAL